ncbi:hypothetical protein PVAP13_7NG211617 [Panicum virgatum]|uniref:Bifunctional inhibitor/plant lipid transfer protein/seed storage helical domain-containing protein n=1 Tax=Panicum virgatum TaxID=38727 RepID=A0A8T0Q0N5_PANVG|nr:hypothetical protein PVAP13_7NG211617 [Panicum virgatum]
MLAASAPGDLLENNRQAEAGQGQGPSSSRSLWSCWPAPPRGADGECGAARPDHLALKLAPCAPAVEDPGSAPSAGCCGAVRDVGRRHSPGCLCALLLSDTARHSGVDLDAAITIPKRCDLATRAPSCPFFAEYTLPGLHE